MKHIAIITFLLCCLASCQKVTYDCRMVINSRIESAAGSIERLDNTVAFAYYGDTLDYKVESYQQAVSGRVTTSKDGQTRPFDMQGDFSAENGQMTFDRISNPVVFIVMCDTENKVYGYCQQSVSKGLDYVYTTFTCPLWMLETQKEVKIGQWYYSK